jgi:hypothetical protein
VLLLNECLLLLISLSTQSGNFWIHPRICSDRTELNVVPSVSFNKLYFVQPPIQWVPGALSLGVERPGLEADHSPPTNSEVKNAWSYTSAPPVRLYSVVLS